jgi:hypothetical protein
MGQLGEAALTGRLYPPGLVGVKTDGRVLSVDFPTSVLKASLSAGEKESFLHDLILYRQQIGRTAHVEGHVYILNL